MVAQYIHKSIDEQKKHSEIKILMKEKAHKPALNAGGSVGSSDLLVACEAPTACPETTVHSSPLVARDARNHNPGGVSDLPRCGHGSALSDWSGEWLELPCGCNFDNTTEHNKKTMSILKLGLHIK